TMVHGSDDTIVARIPHEGRHLPVKRKHLRKSAIVRADDGLAVVLRHSRGQVELTGEAAFVAARQLLPQANRRGGSKRDVQDAVGMIERIGDADAAVRELASLRFATVPGKGVGRSREPLGLGDVRRLALEMALHEEQERRALEGELAALESAWRQAEEIAAIADGMFVDDDVASKLDSLKRGT
ncbi:MAG TPA: hypothetical protein VFV33_14565, partial [Gemmatimonadaceae bacterium]|nr:hypothetical protein [Gemmatimonadaceae bacterium]